MISHRKSNALILRLLLSIFLCVFLFIDMTTASFASYEDIMKQTSKMKKGLIKKVIQEDALLVGQVIGWALEGITESGIIAPVLFETTSAAPPQDLMILNNNFSLKRIVITSYDIPKDSKEQRFVTGLVLHRDALGRIISTVFWTNYTLGSNGQMVIHQTVVRKIDSLYPEVSLYFLPTEKIPHILIKTNNYTDLLKFVTENSISFDNHMTIDRSKKEYYVFAFFMEPLAEDANIDLLVDDSTVELGKTLVVGKDGWYAVYAPATFAIDSKREVLFKAVYTPGGDTPFDQRTERIVSVFTSDTAIKHAQRLLTKYGYKPGPSDGVMGNRTKQAIEQFQQDYNLPDTFSSSQSMPPIKENILLKDPITIKKIQLALERQGYKPGTPDGLMGGKTRRAIMQYQRDIGMIVDGKVSASLLKKLTNSKSQTAPQNQAINKRKKQSKKETKNMILKVSSLSPEQEHIRNILKTKAWPNEVTAP